MYWTIMYFLKKIDAIVSSISIPKYVFNVVQQLLIEYLRKQ